MHSWKQQPFWAPCFHRPQGLNKETIQWDMDDLISGLIIWCYWYWAVSLSYPLFCCLKWVCWKDWKYHQMLFFNDPLPTQFHAIRIDQFARDFFKTGLEKDPHVNGMKTSKSPDEASWSPPYKLIIFVCLSIWVFPKIMVPQNGWFIRENPIKMDDLGYPYFWKHPFCCCQNVKSIQMLNSKATWFAELIHPAISNDVHDPLGMFSNQKRHRYRHSSIEQNFRLFSFITPLEALKPGQRYSMLTSINTICGCLINSTTYNTCVYTY